MTFEVYEDTGFFNYEFGFFDATVPTADSVADKQDWAVQGLSAATSVFDDRLVNPGAVNTVSADAGTEIIFFIVPNDTVASFVVDPDPHYGPGANSSFFSRLHAPIFSFSNANLEEKDQMLSFIGNGVTLFTFEDLSRAESVSLASDEDFGDLAFTIDVELEPIPEPAVVTLMMAIWGLMAWRRPRRTSLR